jgi:hypothetical protein
MNNFRIGAAATAFALLLAFRLIFSYYFTNALPFGFGFVDALIVATGASLFVLSAYEFIRQRFPDTTEMLPMFSGVVWIVLISSYIILRYQPNYQSSLSILVTGVFIGMGWWIQAITTAANARRSHTLNIIMASRTSTEYQQQTRNSSQIYRGQSFIPAELAEWRFNPQKDEFKHTSVPTHISDAIAGTVYILNYFEFLAQGIKYRDLDDRLLKECFSGILAGVERRGFHLIIEAQKGDQRCFEGVIRLAKEWNGESAVEKYRSNPDSAPLGTKIPSGEELQRILNGQPCPEPSETEQKTDEAAPESTDSTAKAD